MFEGTAQEGAQVLLHRDHSICICCADCHLFFIARDYVSGDCKRISECFMA